MANSAEAKKQDPNELQGQKEPQSDGGGEKLKWNYGQEVVVRRTSGHLDTGWKVGQNSEGGERVQVVKEHPTKPGESIEKWITRQELADSNKPDAPKFEAGPGTPGAKFEVLNADGKKVEIVLVSNEDGSAVFQFPEGFRPLPVDFKEVREQSAPTVDDMQNSYDKQVDAQLKAMKIKGDDAKQYKKVAAVLKVRALLEASGTDDPNAVIAEKVKEVMGMDQDELDEAISNPPSVAELKAASAKASFDLSEARTMQEKILADQKLSFASKDVVARYEERQKEKNEPIERNKAMAEAEGTVLPIFIPLYQEGAQAVEGRIEELNAIYRELNDKFDKAGEASDSDKIYLAAVVAERAKHQVVLPMLKKIDRLTAILDEVDVKADQAAEAQIAKARASIADGEMKQGLDLILDPTGWANHYSEGIFGEDSGWDDDDHDDQEAAVQLAQEASENAQELSAISDTFESLGISAEYDADAERAAAKSELQDDLLEMATDGSEEGVREFISFMMEQESTTDIQKEVLQDTLDKLDGKGSEDKVEAKAEAKAEAVVETPEDLDDVMKALFAPEKVTVDNAVMEAAAAELEMSVEQLDGIKAWYEMVKGGIALDEAKHGGGTSMETFGMPDTWDDFLKLSTSEKGIKGFFKRMLGGQSDMKKAFNALKNAPMDLGEIRLRKDSPAYGRFQELKDRANKAPNHVFNVKIG